MSTKKEPKMNIILKIDVTISFILLVLISVMVVIHVIFRLIGKPLYGAEEFERYLFVSLVFLSLSFISRSENHIRFDSLILKFPKKAQQIIELVNHLLCIFVFGITTYSGIVSTGGNMHVKTASLGIPFIVMSLPVVIGFFLVTITYIFKLVHSIGAIIGNTPQSL